MRKDLSDKKNLFLMVLSFFLPIILFSIMLFLLGVLGLPKSFLFQDPTWEFTDFLAGYRRIILGEQSLFYSFNLGMGLSVFPLWAFYLATPLNLLIVFFSSRYISYGFVFITLIKIGLAGLASFFYFNKKQQKDNSIVSLIASLAYSLSAYAIMYAQHFEFLDGLFMLPLLCYGIERLLEKEKPLLYFSVLSFTLITNYYMGFMLCIFSLLWFALQVLLKVEKINKSSLATIKTSFLRYVYSSALAGLSCSVTLLPSLYNNFIQNDRVSGQNFVFKSRYQLLELARQFTTGANFNSVLVFCGVIPLFLAVLYFFNSKVTKKEKILHGALILVLIISTNITFFNSLWHGGSIERGAPFRQSFIIVFVVCYLAHISLQKIAFVQKRSFAMIAAIYILILAINYNYPLGSFDNIILWVDVVMAILAVGLLLGASKNLGKRMAYLCLTLEALNLVAFGVHTLYVLAKADGTSSPSTETAYVSDMEPIINNIKENDGSFYRIEKTFSSSANDGLLLGYNGTSVYTSTTNKYGIRALSSLGMSNSKYAANTVNDMADEGLPYHGCANTDFATSLLGIKYILTDDVCTLSSSYQKTNLGTENISVYQNTNALGIGFVANRAVGEVKQSVEAPIAPMDYMNKIANAADAENEAAFSEINPSSKSLTNLYFNEIDGSYSVIDDTKDAFIEYVIENPTQRPLYYSVSFPGTALDMAGGHASRIAQVVEVTPNGEEKLLGYLNNWPSRISSSKNAKIRIKFVLKTLTLTNEMFYVENTKAEKELFSSLKEQKVVLSEKSNIVEGNIEVEKDNQMLVLTIPYDEGWTIEMDGSAVEYEEVLSGLIGFGVEKGSHEIKLKYVPCGFKIGLIISTLAVGAAAVVMFVDYKATKKKASRESRK